MRARLLSLALLAAGCGGGEVDRDGAGGDGPDGGPDTCDVNADCDDGDACTTDVCDATTGACAVSEIDPCAEATEMVDDDFESAAGALIDDDTFFAQDTGVWVAEPGPECPVTMDIVLEDDLDGYGKVSAYSNGAGGWRLSQTGGGAVRLKVDPDDETNFAVEAMCTTTSGSYGQASHDFAAQATGSLDLRFRPPGKTKAKWITLDEEPTSRFYLYFDNDGQMKYSNAGTKVNLGPYPEDVWMNLRLEWDAGSDRVDLTVDGEVYADLPLHAPIERHIDRMRARTATGTGLSFMIDDVRASGGDEVYDKTGASLRVGDDSGACEGPAAALRAFPSSQAGTLVLDLLARDSGATIDLVGDGQTRMSLTFEPDGGVAWSQGGIRVPVAGAAWTPSEWMRVMLRWDARAGTADLWVDDLDSAAAVALPFEVSGALDGMRAAVSAGGALWLDNLRVSTSP